MADFKAWSHSVRKANRYNTNMNDVTAHATSSWAAYDLILNFQVRKSSINCRLVVKVLLNNVIFEME